MQQSDRIALGIFTGIAIVGLLYVTSEEGEDHKKPRRKRRTLMPDRTHSRDGFVADGSLDFKETEVNSVSPSLSANIDSIKSRSSGTNSVSKSRTSSEIFKSTLPSKSLIRKYPDHYYTLSKKNQWKFRHQEAF